MFFLTSLPSFCHALVPRPFSCFYIQKKTEKPEKPELKPEVFIEFQNRQASESSVVDKVKAAFVASGHRVSSIKSLQIYIKPEEYKAYYVINDNKYSGEVDLF